MAQQRTVGVIPEWYRRLMELPEVSATREAVRERISGLLMAAAGGIGSPPVRIDGDVMILPAALYDLLVQLVDEHGLGEKVQRAVEEDHQRQEAALRRAAEDAGLNPREVSSRPER